MYSITSIVGNELYEKWGWEGMGGDWRGGENGGREVLSDGGQVVTGDQVQQSAGCAAFSLTHHTPSAPTSVYSRRAMPPSAQTIRSHGTASNSTRLRISLYSFLQAAQ